MQPAKQAMTMATLDLASSVAIGHRALPCDLQASVLLFLQKGVGQHRQSPEAYPGLGAHPREWSNTGFSWPEVARMSLFQRAERGAQHFRVRLQLAGSPGGGLSKRCYDHDV